MLNESLSSRSEGAAPLFERIRPYLPTAVFTALIVYFGVHALTGERGLLTEKVRAATLAKRTAELHQVTAERKDLEARVNLLRDDNLSRDLLEERARILLGYADPHDWVIRMPRNKSGRS